MIHPVKLVQINLLLYLFRSTISLCHSEQPPNVDVSSNGENYQYQVTINFLGFVFPFNYEGIEIIKFENFDFVGKIAISNLLLFFYFFKWISSYSESILSAV